MKNKILLLIFLLLLSACQAVKDGLTGRKHENSDEFLVEKKNALEIVQNQVDARKLLYKELSKAEDLFSAALTDIISAKILSNIASDPKFNPKKFKEIFNSR